MKKLLPLILVLVGLSCAGVLQLFALTPPMQPLSTLENLPLYFEMGSGPTSHPAQFIARGGGFQFLISPAAVQLELQKTDAATHTIAAQTVRMQFMGADPRAQILGKDELPGKINYLVGNNPARWRRGIATFARLQVGRLYPGIDLVYYGNQRQLEYDFTVAPGANPEVIRIHFAGVDKVSTGAQGQLILTVGKGEISQPAPIIYQMIDGVRKTVSGRYRLAGEDTVAFTIGKYDGQRPLVIDPILNFSTYFGGNSSDTAWAVALDTNGAIYVAGQTLSKKFDLTPGAFQTNFAGGNSIGDAFVAKFNNQGKSLIYFTYLGGSAEDAAYALAVDDAGDAYVTGFTISSNFPVQNPIPGGATIGGKFDPNVHAYMADAFAAKLDPSGSSLIYSTYLGGAGADAAYGIALDSSNDAYLTGFTYSTNFPTTPDAFQKHLAVTNWAYQAYFNANAFVSEISPFGSNLLYSSYLGGTNYDQGEGIAVDPSNYVYVTGYSASTNFPTTNAIFQQIIETTLRGTNQVAVTNFLNGARLNGSENVTTRSDAFVTKFAPSFTNLVYSTFLGGTNNDVANHIAVDRSGNAYVTGWTISTNFPNTAANVTNLYNGLTNNLSTLPLITNAFLTQITWNGTNAAIGYSAVFGGTRRGADIGEGVALDPFGDAIVVGSSSTTNFPTYNVPGFLSAANSGHNDAFVIAFNTNCSAVLYSGYMGGSGDDYGYGVAVDSLTNAYIVGGTSSANFPILNAYQSTRNGGSDAFLAKIGWVNEPPEITDQSSLTNRLLEKGQPVSLSITASGTPPLHYQWQKQGSNLGWTDLASRTNIFGVTNATLTINPTRTNDSGSYRIVVTNFAGSVTSSNVVLTVTAAPLITLQPTNQTVEAGTTANFYVGGPAYAPPYYFQWFKDGLELTNGTNISGSIISGATNVPLTIINVQTNDVGNYWIVITNAGGAVTSSVVSLTVTTFPTLVTVPTNQTVGLGSTVAFTVKANGGVPLGYQWQYDGLDLTDGTNAAGSIISGSTGATLLINNAQTGDDGGYSVIVTNSFGSVTSSPPAVLTVLTAPTFMGITAGADGSVIFSGTGGTNGGTYLVYTSTNLALPLNQWTAILVNGNKFGSQGQFVFTNKPPADIPQRFYILELPPP